MIFQLHLHMLSSCLCMTAAAAIYVTAPPPTVTPIPLTTIVQGFNALLAFFFTLSLCFFFFFIFQSIVGNAEGKISACANDHTVPGVTSLSSFLTPVPGRSGASPLCLLPPQTTARSSGPIIIQVPF